ncbi:MAG: zinc ABC transporter substrate-binding protein [Candidatus Sumerlaeia bacterium]|nr:zinc ABC transporter substrate-binding protein [Candidatus Sumerlaeia bacterium]
MSARAGIRAVRTATAAALLLVASGLLLACAACRDANGTAPRRTSPVTAKVLTTTSAVHSWAADLLDGVEKPVLLFDQTLTASEPGLSPAQIRLVESAAVLIALGGETDQFARQRFAELNADGALAVAYPNLAGAGWVWLDGRQAVTGVQTLAGELRALFPEQAARITRNEETLVRRIEAADRSVERRLAPVAGRAVFLHDGRLKPFAERYGLTVRDVISHRHGMAPTPEELTDFQNQARRVGRAVVLAGTQPGPEVLGIERDGVRPTLVLVDPVLAGYVGPGHFERQLERNALLVAAVLLGGAGS